MLKWVFFFYAGFLMKEGRKVRVKGDEEEEERENKGRWMDV